MTPPRRRPPVPAGRALGALRPPPPRRPRRPLRGHLIPATPPPPAAAISHRCDREEYMDLQFPISEGNKKS
ncbi:hypothetical protein OPV22_007156 [Ensete ventricosum]|uniref:Uncharacterized protein n=1 Tax=Ensete ventricosum TaxID=4639 RepID=A0AAV8RSN0_ENSVE|nr:hypothetical protein OPV22_007156 [Ensete ventricosum]